MEPEYVKVDQHVTLKQIRADKSLPELVRYPSLEKMRQEIERLRKVRADERARRRQERAQAKDKGAHQ